jgi:hypothetical protein
MIFSAVIAVAVGWLTRSYWLAFVSGLALAYASAGLTWLLFSDIEGLNEYQFRTILAGFMAGALGIIVAFLRTAYDEYRQESREAKAAETEPRQVRAGPKPSLAITFKRRLRNFDRRSKRLGNDLSNMTFGVVDRWVNRSRYRDDPPRHHHPAE